MHILDRIVEYKKEEVMALKRRGLPEPDEAISRRRDFKGALNTPPYPNIIAEIKKASPSKGIIREDFEPVEIGRYYAKTGANAVSILTDQRFFQGRSEYVAAVRRAIDLPILRKDFIIDHIQVDEAWLIGADAILLIVACLDDSLLGELMSHAQEVGLECLVEVHNESEAERALGQGAEIIGINNRDLKDFSVSIDTTFRVMGMLPGDKIVVSESGIGDTDAYSQLKDHGVHAVLVGEAFMRRPGLLEEFVAIRQGG